MGIRLVSTDANAWNCQYGHSASSGVTRRPCKRERISRSSRLRSTSCLARTTARTWSGTSNRLTRAAVSRTPNTDTMAASSALGASLTRDRYAQSAVALLIACPGRSVRA
ncbi:Uncharacterised protein [Mycobacteroides abscessus subsp. abscessus]|nr:Uncharacterised protein [Mycobacteroides abscessus subsp. abscessus]